MADQTKNICEENHNISAKAQELLTRLSSTVFACDISGDTRYIRCDFPQCRQHAEALQGKPCWILNTLKNVRVLESHVGKEVHHYMKEIDSESNDHQVANVHYVDSQHWIEAQGLPEGTRKVLAVFNLKDPQSQFGDWISLFLKAALMAEGVPQHGCIVITQSFVSRCELMECVANLKFLRGYCPTVEVVAVLSCHSSCQGQVFSCTPFALGKKCEFEEFCSLHDFVMACQSVLNNVLMAVHISSCFTLKLDCSHVDWPVDADWLKTKLQCILCGSTKEVYETGSQVADLHLMLSTMLPSITSSTTCGTRLRDAVDRACMEGFPDLAREMGLEVLDSDTVNDRLSMEGKDDQVTPPGLVMSSVRVVLLVQDDGPGTSSKKTDESRNCGSYIALANAITANLQIRRASDVKFEYMVVQVKHSETCLLKESLKNHLSLLPCDSFKVLFVAIGPMFSRPNVELIEVVKEWNNQKTGGICYGIHFQHITAMQAYVIKNRFVEIQHDDTSVSNAEKSPYQRHVAVTGLVDNGNKNCSASFPVLLYMIHLAVGENGNRLAGKGIPSAVYSNKAVGHGVSSWTLEEVYMETCHVLSGLSSKCGLHLLSPVLSPMRLDLAISPCHSSACSISSEGTTLESVHKKDENFCQSSPDIKPTTSRGEVSSPFVITTVPTNAGATMKEVNVFESVQKEDGSNSKPMTGGYSVNALCHEKTPSTIGLVSADSSIPLANGSNSVFVKKSILENEETGCVTVVTKAGSKEKGGINGVFSCDGKILAANEEPNRVTFVKKPLTIGAIVDYSSSSGEEARLIHDEGDFDGETVGLACLQKESLSIGAFLKDASLPEEDRVSSKLDNEKESPTRSQDATNLSQPEENRGAVKLDHERPGVACLLKELSTITPVFEEDLSLSRECGKTVPLEDNEDKIEEELVGLTCLKKESSTIGAFLEGESSTEKKASTLNLDKLELDEKPVSGICDKNPSSTANESFSEGEESLAVCEGESYVLSDSDDTDRKGWSVTESDVQNICTSQSGSESKVPFQTWLQNFRKYCKEEKHVMVKESCQGLPSKRRRNRRKDLQKRSAKKHCMSGNLESKNKCLGVTKGCCCSSEMSATTACSSATDLNLESGSGEQVNTPNSMESETESVSARNTVADVFKNTNLFEIMEAKESCVNRDDCCTEKRPLVLDYSSDMEVGISAKKPKHEPECESTCETTIEESMCSTSNDWEKSEDLPLMANVDEVLVNHYILDLTVKFSEKIMKGSIVLFLEPSNEEVTKRQFQMTLDSTLVNIESVNEVVLPKDFKLTFFSHEQSGALTDEASSSFLDNMLDHNTQNPLPFKGLPYSVYGWFVQIWKPDATGKAWPRCIWIKYHTSPEGKSLTWATDQDGKPCVYSPGAYINNRSLMPCQEPPVAMASWQAAIHVPEGCVVLMSGNELVGRTTPKDGQVTYLYEMGIPLPCATLAVAVGWWECRQSRNADTKDGANPNVPVTCRMFAPPSVIERAADELLGYAPMFLEASCELLGPYPFRRLDMLILPKCFACMGLKSPNLVFLSQSLLSGDASMRVRLAHEISHAWFGLLIGTKDWSEEWLSEGFATFIEEKIQSRAEKWSKDKDRFYREIRQILRHRCLLFEIKECDDSLKYLRPKVVKPSSALSTAEAIEKSASQTDAVRPHTVVQFGQICSRKWTQVHYLKGYFLLHHLAMMVGLEEFDAFLFNYVQHYKGQLVSSEDFFEFFVQSFSNISSETKDKFIREWLERAGLPKSFLKRFDSPDNELVSQVEHEFQVWKKQDATNKRNKTLKVRKRTKPPASTLELPEQVVLFLEKLLERDTLSHNTLRQLDKCYHFSDGNAEIRHRWCELVVKHKFTPALQEVKRFLVEDQGMGIYLFGELIISQQPKQRALVDEVLEEIGAEMDRCTYQTVKDMLEGND